MVKQSKYKLDTPCLILDIDLLEQNLATMQTITRQAGKRLRPHAKTHKCSTLAKKQLAAGAGGICVAKVSEAEALVNAGVHAILITGPLSTDKKIERALDVLAASPSLMAVIDSDRGLELLSSALRARDLKMDVLLDLDVGHHRTGIDPSNALALAESILSKPELSLKGIQAYAGQVQHIQSFQQRRKASLESLEPAAAVFREIKSRSENCNIFSASGTGTFNIDIEIPELTELQVGSYACMDVEYLAVGSRDNPQRFTTFVPALRILTSVISTNQPGFVTIDAGLKSLYKDGGIPQVLDETLTKLEYTWFGDEYGKITSADGHPLPAQGSVLELVTSHCDPTINLYDRFYITRGDEVVDVWPIDLRGCSQ